MLKVRSYNNTATYIILAILSLTAIVMVLRSTSLCGAGMSTDAICYVSAARHLLEGKGYLDYDGRPYTHWPPLLPTILALLGLVGIEPLDGTRFVNAVSFGLIVFTSGSLFLHQLKSKLLVISGAVTVLMSFALLKISVYAWSEPLFIVLTVLFTFNLARFLRNRNMSSLIFAGIFAALSCLQRYVGITVIITGCIMVLFYLRNVAWLKRLKYAAIFGTISFAPTVLWIIRNKLTASTAGGYQFNFDASFQQKATQMLGFTTPWFVTEKISLALRLVIIGAVACLLAAAVVVRRHKFGKEQAGDTMLTKVATAFVLIYTGFALLAAVFINVHASERMFSPVYVFLIFFVLIGLEAVGRLLSLVLKKEWAGYLVITGLCSLWLILYPVSVIKQRISSYEKNGVPGYNSVFWHRSDLIKWLKEHPLRGQLFSNEAHAIYFLSGFDTRMSPRRGEVAQFRQSMSAERKNYLFWFYRNWRSHLYDLKELNSMFKLRLVARLRDGAVFTME